MKFQKSLNFQILFTSTLLIAVILLFEFSNLDILVQNYFYDFSNKKWLIDRNNNILKFLLYNGVKRLLIAILVAIFFALIFFRKKEVIKKYQKGLLIILLSGILIPSSVGILKKITKVPCPRNIIEYNGKHPYIKVFQQYPQNSYIKKRIKCWPAGHASGGFALLSLFFLFMKDRNKILSLLLAASIGWTIGVYKMLIGDHFLSHNIVTMLIAWLIILIIVKITEKYSDYNKKL